MSRSSHILLRFVEILSIILTEIDIETQTILSGHGSFDFHRLFVKGIQVCDANCARCRVFAHQVSGCNPDRKVPCQTGWHCMECRPGYELWFDRCFQPCPAGYFRYGYQCQRCSLNCLECTGPHPHECIRCAPTHIFDDRKLCTKRCPDGFYPALDDGKTGATVIYPDLGDGRRETVDYMGCGTCHHTCKTCRSWTAIACTSCDAESYFRPIFFAANAGITERQPPGTGECVKTPNLRFYRRKPEDTRQYECPEGTLECESSWRAFRCDPSTHFPPIIQADQVPKCHAIQQLDQSSITAETYLGDAVNNPGAPSWSSVSDVALEGLGVMTAAAAASSSTVLRQLVTKWLRRQLHERDVKRQTTTPAPPRAVYSGEGPTSTSGDDISLSAVQHRSQPATTTPAPHLGEAGETPRLRRRGGASSGLPNPPRPTERIAESREDLLHDENEVDENGNDSEEGSSSPPEDEPGLASRGGSATRPSSPVPGEQVAETATDHTTTAGGGAVVAGNKPRGGPPRPGTTMPAEEEEHGQEEDQRAHGGQEEESDALPEEVSNWINLHTYVSPGSILEKAILSGEAGKNLSTLFGELNRTQAEQVLYQAGKRRLQKVKELQQKVQKNTDAKKQHRERKAYDGNVERVMGAASHREHQRLPRKRNRYKGKRTRAEVLQAEAQEAAAMAKQARDQQG
ncbi:unnamed protein product [Amoebophrya sp. A120]|nr:unnamed protein product [Amoebophrya sp. A120]|eukprot:GSA120T00015028001.1